MAVQNAMQDNGWSNKQNISLPTAFDAFPNNKMGDFYLYCLYLYFSLYICINYMDILIVILF